MSSIQRFQMMPFAVIYVMGSPEQGLIGNGNLDLLLQEGDFKRTYSKVGKLFNSYEEYAIYVASGTKGDKSFFSCSYNAKSSLHHLSDFYSLSHSQRAFSSYPARIHQAQPNT
jgi:hypothetical protein